VEESLSEMRITLADDGKGMDEATVRRAMDPFYSDGVKHPGRRVGLGIPFLRQMVDATGGTFRLESSPGQGTRLEIAVPRDHIDLPPAGDLPTAFQQALCFAGDFEMSIEHRRDDGAYRLLRSELRDALGELDTVGSQVLLREYIAAQEASLIDTETEAE
jgi:hypothetical protein